MERFAENDMKRNVNFKLFLLNSHLVLALSSISESAHFYYGKMVGEWKLLQSDKESSKLKFFMTPDKIGSLKGMHKCVTYESICKHDFEKTKTLKNAT